MKTTALEPTDVPTPAAANATERTPDYAIYKPNSRGTGGVVRFGLNRAKGAVFVDAVNGVRPRALTWRGTVFE